MKKDIFKELVEKSVEVAVKFAGFDEHYMDEITINRKTYDITVHFDNGHDCVGQVIKFEDLDLDAGIIVSKYEIELEEAILMDRYKKFINDLTSRGEFGSIKSFDLWKFDNQKGV